MTINELFQEAAEPMEPLSPPDAAMHALRDMHAILDTFPLVWQVAIVKALTARIIVRVRERIRSAQAVTSA